MVSLSLTPKRHPFTTLQVHPLPLVSAPQAWFLGRAWLGLARTTKQNRCGVWPPVFQQTTFVGERIRGGLASENPSVSDSPTLSKCLQGLRL